MTTRDESDPSGGGGAGGSAGGAGGSTGGARAARRRGISPGVVFLAIALIGSVVFVLYSVTVRDASQIPLLAAGSLVLGIVFIALAVYTVRATWRAGVDGRGGRALLLGIGGGIAAIIGAGCLAAAIILFLLSQPPAA
ncbi:MAG: hypothetical protein QOE66_2559 [Chloroflexota bacterium]|nr:hypothetical protein [Chloroflexota bacterium]